MAGAIDDHGLGIELAGQHARFLLRTDDAMLHWTLLLAGAGIGIAQVVLAKRHDELEQVAAGIPFASLPVWLVMSEEVRSNARIRRVGDFLSAALSEVLRD